MRKSVSVEKQLRQQERKRRQLIERHYAKKHDDPRNGRVVKCMACRAEF